MEGSAFLVVIFYFQKAILIINQCCSIVSPNDTFLVAKGCQLISNLINKQHVKVEGKTLTLAVSWCTQSLKHCGDIAVLDILQALEALLRGNGIYIEEVCHIFSKSLNIIISFIKYHYHSH